MTKYEFCKDNVFKMCTNSRTFLLIHSTIEVLVSLTRNSLILRRHMYRTERNFRWKKISRTLAKFVKLDSIFDLPKCRFTKINSREIFQNW